MIPPEHSIDLRSLSEFQGFCQANGAWFFDQRAIDRWVDSVRSREAIEPLTGEVIRPGHLEVAGNNYRETLSFKGNASRHRAVFAAVASFLGEFYRKPADIDIYAPEAVTAFARQIARVFPKFVGSEYAADKSVRDQVKNVRIEDLMDLTFADASFDLVCSNDVLEHVPSIDMALREMMRVLRPGGVLISTHPFAAASETPVKRAEIVGGRVNHILPPEYHGNPVDPAGSLVFEVPGWDIVRRCREAGASDAFIRISGSEKHAYIGAQEAGIYMTIAIK
jgi:SAM-dependent methyltransferase